MKSVLNKDDLLDAIANVASLKRIDPQAKGSVFAFRGMDWETLRSHLMGYVEGAKGGRHV